MFFEVTAGVALIAWLSKLRQKSSRLSVAGKGTGAGLLPGTGLLPPTGSAGGCCGCEESGVGGTSLVASVSGPSPGAGSNDPLRYSFGAYNCIVPGITPTGVTCL
jgi:hypothetical protein